MILQYFFLKKYKFFRDVHLKNTHLLYYEGGSNMMETNAVDGAHVCFKGRGLSM